MFARPACPACLEPSGPRVLADLRYDEPPIVDYLATFYRNHPRCDFSPLRGHVYRLRECIRCGCIYQDPVPDATYLSAFYAQGLYGSADPAAANPPNPHATEHAVRELMMVVRHLAARHPRPRCLDFGTGDGHWAILAAACGVETHACDLSTHAFARLGHHGITCHPLAELPEAHFDFINTEQVFEHLTDPVKEVARLARSLRPGGVLKIGVPHDAALRLKLAKPDWAAPKNTDASLNGVAPIEHLNHFEPASLDALAAKAGLEALPVRGWELLPASAYLHPLGPRKRAGLWLRTQLHEVYRPFFARTQTRFYRKPWLAGSGAPASRHRSRNDSSNQLKELT